MRAILILAVLQVCLLSACGGDSSPARVATERSAPTATVVSDDSETVALILEPHPVGVTHVAWSPDGTLLATSDGLVIRLWDADVSFIAELTTQPATITSLSWSSDSQMLATGDSSGVVSLWNRDGALLSSITLSEDDPPAPVASVVWSPVEPLLATGITKAPDAATPGQSPTLPATVQLWQPDGTEEQSFEIAHSFRGAVNLSWSADGSRLAAGGNDIHIWETNGNEAFLVEGGEFHFRPSMAFSPDGARLAFTDVAGTLHVHRLDGSPPLSGGAVAVDRAVVFSPDSTLIAVATDNLLIVLGSDDPIGQRVNALTNGVQSAPAWSPDSTMLAAGVARRAVHVVTPAGETVAILSDCEGRVTGVDWSADGTRIAAGFADGQVCIWEAPTPD